MMVTCVSSRSHGSDNMNSLDVKHLRHVLDVLGGFETFMVRVCVNNSKVWFIIITDLEYEVLGIQT